MRPSSMLFLVLFVLISAFSVSIFESQQSASASTEQSNRNAELVQQLGLSDIALFTEARYTRHLSQTDRHSAFQDHPMALEHFPSGSLVYPPASLFDE